MASRLGYSEFNSDNTNNKPNKRKNKTVKRRAEPSKVSSFLKAMEDGGKEDDTNGLADFNPPKSPELTKQPAPVQINNDNKNSDEALNISAFENLDNFTPQREYMDQYIPYYTKAANDANAYGNKEPLLENKEE